eukprot:2776183-Prymnesium_polylepis.1
MSPSTPAHLYSCRPATSVRRACPIFTRAGCAFRSRRVDSASAISVERSASGLQPVGAHFFFRCMG